MRDLTRIRGERELWITRGHLYALAAMTCFIGLLAFFVGLLFGRSGWGGAPPQAPAQALITPEMEANELDELLARVEAGGGPAQDQALTFQDTLRSGATPPAPVEEQAPGEEIHVAASHRVPDTPETPVVGDVPEEGWSVQVASTTSEAEADEILAQLGEAGVEAYRVAGVTDGLTWYRVRTGGFSSREEAEGAREEVATRSGRPDCIVVRAP